MLSEQLFEKCEEFFDLISKEHRTDDVEGIIDHLTEFLVDEVDGHTNRKNFLVAEEVELQIKELWELLPADERRTNNNLRDYYDDLMESLAGVLDVSLSDVGNKDCAECDFDSDDSDFGDEEDFQ